MSKSTTIRAFAAVALGVVLGGCDPKKAPPAPPPPPEVETLELQPRDVSIIREWVASVDGMVNADIRAQVSGYLTKQTYLEGSAVKTGDVRFEIDPRPFVATLDQANGELGRQVAALAKASQDVERYTPLVREQAISQQELDDAVQAKASAEAAVAAAQAVVEGAKLNLGFTKVTSLIDGVAGMAKAQIGDLIGPQSGGLTTVSTLDPVKVYFTVSEQEYLDWARRFPTAELRDAKSKALRFQLVLANGVTYDQTGTWLFADRQVDPRTGAMRLALTFPNPGDVLRPGQFGRVRAVTREDKDALVIPQRAVSELQGIRQVSVVKADNTVEMRPVEMGERVGSDWVVKKGLKAGDKVVVEGLQKIRPGGTVNPKPFAPKAPAAAAPAAPAPAPPGASSGGR